MLLIEIFIGKIEPVVWGEHNFEYIKTSTLFALSGIFALQRVRRQDEKR